MIWHLKWFVRYRLTTRSAGLVGGSLSEDQAACLKVRREIGAASIVDVHAAIFALAALADQVLFQPNQLS